MSFAAWPALHQLKTLLGCRQLSTLACCLFLAAADRESPDRLSSRAMKRTRDAKAQSRHHVGILAGFCHPSANAAKGSAWGIREWLHEAHILQIHSPASGAETAANSSLLDLSGCRQAIHARCPGDYVPFTRMLPTFQTSSGKSVGESAIDHPALARRHPANLVARQSIPVRTDPTMFR